MFAIFNRFQIQMTMRQAKQAYHQGQCEPDVEYLANVPRIANQLDKLDPNHIAAELREYGAWDEGELRDLHHNRLRLVWIAAGNIVEEAKSNG